MSISVSVTSTAESLVESLSASLGENEIIKVIKDLDYTLTWQSTEKLYRYFKKQHKQFLREQAEFGV